MSRAPRPRHKVGPQSDAFVKDSVDLTPFQAADAGRVVRHRLVVEDLTTPADDVCQRKAVGAQHHIDHHGCARVGGAASRHPQRVTGFGDVVQTRKPEPIRDRKAQPVIMRQDRDCGDPAHTVERPDTAVGHREHGCGIEDRNVDPPLIDGIYRAWVIGTVQSETTFASVAFHRDGDRAILPVSCQHHVTGDVQEQHRTQVAGVDRKRSALIGCQAASPS
ncbi:hypothetical protein [Mycobacterium sp.]|uniref:hypothetical protein n=1 Tax=Mycobacterium sp. TaxID=1785 RepID=UPI003F993362